jgi:hypothetical protein
MKGLYLEMEKVTEPILLEITRDRYGEIGREGEREREEGREGYPASQKLSISTQHCHHSPLAMVAIKHFACHYDSMQVTKLHKAAAPVRPSGKPNKREAKKPNTHTHTYICMS